MGEIAESMLNGLLCEMCGTVIDGEEPGYPRYCSEQCAADRGVAQFRGSKKEFKEEPK